MVIGNRLSFAVEFELDKEYNGAWLYGKFCYWIKGKQIGNYDIGTSLRDVLFSLDTLVHDNGNRTDENLFMLLGEELFSMLDGALYGNEESQYDEVAYMETWAKFNVVLPVDVFNGYKIFLVESNEISRILIKKESYIKIQEEQLPKGLFDEVIEKAHQELNRLYETEFENS